MLLIAYNRASGGKNMLLMRLTTTKILTLRQEQLLKEKIGELSHDKNIMIHIEDNQVMYFNHEELECILIECQFSHFENIKEFTKSFMAEIESITGIPLKRQYLMIQECQYLGNCGV